MKIVQGSISIKELNIMASALFGNMVKAVVDTDKALLAVDAELHADLEALLIENGSKASDLWGINIYPELKDDRIEFDSMINLKPAQGNRTRGVEDSKIRERILSITNLQIKDE